MVSATVGPSRCPHPCPDPIRPQSPGGRASARQPSDAAEIRVLSLRAGDQGQFRRATDARIGVRAEGNTLLVEVVGELDLASAPRLASCLRDLRGRAATVAVDLAGVTFIDLELVLLGAARRSARRALYGEPAGIAAPGRAYARLLSDPKYAANARRLRAASAPPARAFRIGGADRAMLGPRSVPLSAVETVQIGAESGPRRDVCTTHISCGFPGTFSASSSPQICSRPRWGPDLNAHGASLQQYADAGVDELFAQQIGPAQDVFFMTWRRRSCRASLWAAGAGYACIPRRRYGWFRRGSSCSMASAIEGM